jgi:hypothetical protein
MVSAATFYRTMNAAREEARCLDYSVLANRLEHWGGRKVRPNTIDHAIYFGYVIEAYRLFGTWLMDTEEVCDGSR